MMNTIRRLIVLSTAENQQHRWVKRGNLVDSRTSVTDVKFGPKHLGLILVSCVLVVESSTHVISKEKYMCICIALSCDNFSK